MLNGLQSNPDCPGTEKFVMTTLDEQWLQDRRLWISCSDLDLGSDSKDGLMPPQGIFAVKGWNRSCCALLVLLAAYEMRNLFGARLF